MRGVGPGPSRRLPDVSADRPEAAGPDGPTPAESVIDPSWAKRSRGPKRTPRPDAKAAPAAEPESEAVPDDAAPATVLITEREEADGPANGAAGADATAEVEAIPGAFVPLSPPTAATVPEPVAPPPHNRRQAVRRGRRVKRVVRRVELWSVLKLSLVLYTCLYVAVLATIALVWGLAYSSGQIDNLQKFLADVGLENYRFYGDQMFRACAAIGAVGVLAGTVITVLTAALVNVISETTGGIRLVVIEEDVIRPR